MLGWNDVALIFAATAIANLIVEVGAEVIAEWVVNSPESPLNFHAQGLSESGMPGPLIKAPAALADFHHQPCIPTVQLDAFGPATPAVHGGGLDLAGAVGAWTNGVADGLAGLLPSLGNLGLW